MLSEVLQTATKEHLADLKKRFQTLPSERIVAGNVVVDHLAPLNNETFLVRAAVRGLLQHSESEHKALSVEVEGLQRPEIKLLANVLAAGLADKVGIAAPTLLQTFIKESVTTIHLDENVDVANFSDSNYPKQCDVVDLEQSMKIVAQIEYDGIDVFPRKNLLESSQTPQWAVRWTATMVQIHHEPRRRDHVPITLLQPVESFSSAFDLPLAASDLFPDDDFTEWPASADDEQKTDAKGPDLAGVL